MSFSWFSTIRSGRFLYNDTILQDKVSKKGPLQQWVGLNNELFPSKRETKARSALHTSIQKELSTGIGNLHPSSYTQFFRQSFSDISSLPIKAQKDWFQTIRTARFKYEKNNTHQDGFSKLGYLQRWAGLEHSLYI